MTLTQIFKSLSGKWSLERILGAYGIIEGLATFSEGHEINILDYREDFNISNFNQNSMRSYKEYEYHLLEDKIVKYFKSENNSKRMFYELEFLSDDFAVAQHICNLDRYDVEYKFKNPGNFKLKYSVKGPRKDYIIETEFTKILAG
jgi:hypothetical protein